MKRILIVLSIAFPALLSAQGLGVRLDGGAQYTAGGGFSGAGTRASIAVQPIGEAGLFYQFSDRLRAGVDYSYTRMYRDQFSGTMLPLGRRSAG